MPGPGTGPRPGGWETLLYSGIREAPRFDTGCPDWGSVGKCWDNGLISSEPLPSTSPLPFVQCSLLCLTVMTNIQFFRAIEWVPSSLAIHCSALPACPHVLIMRKIIATLVFSHNLLPCLLCVVNMYFIVNICDVTLNLAHMHPFWMPYFSDVIKNMSELYYMAGLKLFESIKLCASKFHDFVSLPSSSHFH